MSSITYFRNCAYAKCLSQIFITRQHGKRQATDRAVSGLMKICYPHLRLKSRAHTPPLECNQDAALPMSWVPMGKVELPTQEYVVEYGRSRGPVRTYTSPVRQVGLLCTRRHTTTGEKTHVFCFSHVSLSHRFWCTTGTPGTPRQQKPARIDCSSRPKSLVQLPHFVGANLES